MYCNFPGLTPKVAAKKYSLLDSTSMIAATRPKELVTFNATRLSANSGVILLKGANSRSCRIYFDEPVVSLRVTGGNDRVQKEFPMPHGGASEVRLWSRTWERTFEVFFDWEGKTLGEKVGGRVSCNWAEMGAGRIPALDEVVNFLPAWALVSKLTDGLVEGFKRFEI